MHSTWRYISCVVCLILAPHFTAADIEKTTTYNVSTAQIGSSFLLNCKYEGFSNQTLVSLQWQLDNLLIYYRQFEKNRGRTIQDMEQFFDVNVNSQPLLTTSSLKLEILRQHFSGTYKCIKSVRIQRFNSKLNKTEDETKVFTEIHSVIFEKVDFLRQLRDEINETCYSPKFASPKNARLIWVKEAQLDDEQADLQYNNGTIIRDLSKLDERLRLDSLTLLDTGTYACYDRGFKVRSFSLLVLDHVTAPESESLVIPCGRTNKADIHMISKDNNIIYFDGEIRWQTEIYSLNEKGHLVLSSAVPEDSGIYKCYGLNSLYKVLNVTVEGDLTERNISIRNIEKVALTSSKLDIELSEDVNLVCTFTPGLWRVLYFLHNDVIIHVETIKKEWSQIDMSRHKHELTDSIYTLHLDNTTTKDLGRYKCRVQYEFHMTESAEVVIKSSKPASRNILLPIKNDNDTSSHSIFCSLPVLENQPVFWFKNGHPLHLGDQNLEPNNGYINNMTTYVLNTDWGFNGIYDCYSGDRHLPFDVTYSFNLTALPPNATTDGVSRAPDDDEIHDSLTIKGSHVVNHPGDNLTLTCDGLKADNVVVYWFFGEQLILMRSSYKNYTWTESDNYESSSIDTFTIVHVDEIDIIQDYTCFMFDLDPLKTYKSKPFDLQIYKSKVSHVASTPVMLTCDAAHQPVTWMKEEALVTAFAGYPLFQDNTYSSYNASLFIHRIGKNQKGVYRCIDGKRQTRRTVYFNTLGSYKSTNRIRDEPNRVNITINRGGRAGRKFQLFCNHDFQPDLVYWRWENGSSIFQIEGVNTKASFNYLYEGNQTKNAHILTVVYYSEYDFGYYECFAVKGDYVYHAGRYVGGITYVDPDEEGEKGEALWNVVEDISVTHTYDKNTKTLQLTCFLDDIAYNESSKIYWLKNRKLIYITNKKGENWGIANYKAAFSNSSDEFRLDYTGPIKEDVNGGFTCSVFLVVTPEQPDDVDTLDRLQPYRVVYVGQTLTINEFEDDPNPFEISANFKENERKLSLKCNYKSIEGKPEYVYWNFKKEEKGENHFLIMHSDETFADDKNNHKYQFYNLRKQILIPESSHYSTQPIHCRFAAGCTELVISNFGEGNVGIYECYVKPIGRPLVKTNNYQSEEPNPNKALIDFRIFDSVECGNAEPKQGIVWTVNDQILVLDSDLVMDNVNTLYKPQGLDVLEFHNISEIQNGIYKCFLRQSGALLSVYNVVLKPASVYVNKTEEKLGQLFKVICHFPNLEPELVYLTRGTEIYYYDGINNVNDYSRYRGHINEEDYFLEVDYLDLSPGDVGNYTCHVQLGGIYKEEKRILSASISIDLESVAAPLQPNQGMEIQIQCKVPESTTQGEDYKLFWFKDDQLINNGNKTLFKEETYKVVSTNDSLAIKNILPSDNGVYKCYFRGIKFQEFTINVIPPPVIETTFFSNLNGQNGYWLGAGIAILIVGLLIFALWLTRLQKVKPLKKH